MLDSFTIGAFRGLRDVKLDGLARINLLVGGGGSGKTSVLEALAFLGDPYGGIAWAPIAQTREIGFESLTWLDAIRWLFPNRPGAKFVDAPAPISLMSTGEFPIQRLDATFSWALGNPPASTQLVLGGMVGANIPAAATSTATSAGSAFGYARQMGAVVRVSVDAEPHIQRGKLGESVEIQLFPWTYQEAVRQDAAASPIRVVHLAPYAHRNPEFINSGFTAVSIDRTKDLLPGLIRDLDPEISVLEMLATESGRRPVLVARRHDSAQIPVTVHGDGLRKAISIAIAVIQAKGGVLLIDEIESALHHSALEKVFQWLHKSCKDLNVQVFMTSHSLEAIGIMSAVAGRENADLAAFHLSTAKIDRTTKRYSARSLHSIVAEGGLDVR